MKKEMKSFGMRIRTSMNTILFSVDRYLTNQSPLFSGDTVSDIKIVLTFNIPHTIIFKYLNYSGMIGKVERPASKKRRKAFLSGQLPFM